MLLSIDENDERPLYRQLVAQVKQQVADGVLRPGDDLPSVREVAASLGVNLHTVRHAYQVLRDQGVIDLRLGRRARVAERRPVPATRDEVATRLTPLVDELASDAFHLGLSPADVRRLVDDALRTRTARSRRSR
jgi:GntR family transcriptional regulator